MYKGYKLLNAKERKHLREQGIYTTFELEATFAKQAKLRSKYPSSEPCWDCRGIAEKLSYKVETRL